MNDIEQLKMIDLEDQLRFARDKNKELQKEVKRLKMLLKTLYPKETPSIT